ncbi:MAG TPA: hypothetical protein VH208_08630, partial [Myxococcaceae bacterium]|nr:hypothetical protein [Myxococcaceae bacterium]
MPARKGTCLAGGGRVFPISTRLIAGAVVTAGLVSCAGRAIGTAAGDAGGGAPDAGRKADAGGADAGPDGGATFDGGWYYDGGPWWGDGGVYNVGWTELPNTRLASVCFDPANGCAPVISAWNSGVADPVRSRLLFWGGGHNDYGGNEIYSLNLLAGTLTRVTGQSPPAYCQEASTDGRPNARHTYDGIALLAGMDQVFEYGGYLSCDGSAAGISRATWTLRLSDLSWTRMDPTLGTGPVTQADCCDYIAAADFDPLTQR